MALSVISDQAQLRSYVDQAVVSCPVIDIHTHVSQAAKYDKGGMELIVPARIPSEADERVRELAIRSYVATECEGMARIDFFVRPDGEVVVNEINTIPGFTSISMFPKLWGAAGLDYDDLLSRLVELGLERHHQRRGLRTDYR